MQANFFLYRKLDFLKNYNFKFLFVAFFGIHIPLIGIIFYLVSINGQQIDPFEIAALTLILTLIATGATLFVLNQLLLPIKVTQAELNGYLKENKIPQLPKEFKDDIGKLMAKIQITIENMQQLLDEKQDLISLLSHDIRGPIHQIAGLSQILKQPGLSEAEKMNYIDLIDNLCWQQTELLNGLLDILRQQKVVLTPAQFRKTNLQRLLNNCLQEHETALEKKEVTINLLQADQAINVFVEETLFQQAVKNILQNAIKFSYPKGKIDITVKTRQRFLFLEIRDYGAGFDPSVSAQLFDRFTKQGKKGTLQEPSTGIGLHLTRKIIEQHNGSIEAYSQGTDQGATFIIKLRNWQTSPAFQFSSF